MSASMTLVSSFLAALALLAAASDAAVITVVNQCPFTVWAASVPVGGGRQLNNGETWQISVPAGTTAAARIWARTGCQFDASGHGGSCRTGDCGGVLQCTGYGRAPNTLAELALNQFNNLDFFDISLVDGFNVPMSLLPDGDGGSAGRCSSRGARCAVDVNARCPDELRQDGACNSACLVFKQDVYCCVGSAANNCGPTKYSRYFKEQCPDAYSYPKDDPSSTFTCPAGTNYKVVFCPSG